MIQTDALPILEKMYEGPVPYEEVEKTAKTISGGDSKMAEAILYLLTTDDGPNAVFSVQMRGERHLALTELGQTLLEKSKVFKRLTHNNTGPKITDPAYLRGMIFYG